MPSLCALLGNVEITVCPGEVTSTQELRAVSKVSACTLLRMHGATDSRDPAFYQNSMIYGQTGGYIYMDKYY